MFRLIAAHSVQNRWAAYPHDGSELLAQHWTCANMSAPLSFRINTVAVLNSCIIAGLGERWKTPASL